MKIIFYLYPQGFWSWRWHSWVQAPRHLQVFIHHNGWSQHNKTLRWSQHLLWPMQRASKQFTQRWSHGRLGIWSAYITGLCCLPWRLTAAAIYGRPRHWCVFAAETHWWKKGKFSNLMQKEIMFSECTLHWNPMDSASEGLCNTKYLKAFYNVRYILLSSNEGEAENNCFNWDDWKKKRILSFSYAVCFHTDTYRK